MQVPLSISCFVLSQLLGSGALDFSRSSWSPGSLFKPSTAYIDHRGNIAALGLSSSGRDTIFLSIRGKRHAIDGPSDDLLAKAFFSAQLDHHGKRIFPRASIVAIALQNEIPIVTVANQLSGAYSGTEEVSFKWINSRWIPLSINKSRSHQNYYIVGGDASEAIFGIDDLGTQPALIPDTQRAYPQAVGTLVVGRAKSQTIFQSIPTDGYGGAFWGYRAIQRVDTTFVPEAFEWRAGHTRDLYQGIAWGANASGVVVGDDRAQVNFLGHPLAVLPTGVRRLSPLRGVTFVSVR